MSEITREELDELERRYGPQDLPPKCGHCGERLFYGSNDYYFHPNTKARPQHPECDNDVRVIDTEDELVMRLIAAARQSLGDEGPTLDEIEAELRKRANEAWELSKQ